MAPDSVGTQARERSVEIFSLTDHDTCAGHAAAAQSFGQRAVRGVELSCDDSGQTVHVLTFDTGGAWHELEANLAERAERRRDRLRTIGAQLARRGVHIDVEAILAAAGGRAVGRPDLARALVAQGLVSSTREAFTRYLYDGGPGDAGGHRLSLREGLALGRAVGARMSLAHPHLIPDRAARLLRTHKDDGLDAVEAYYATYDATERGRWTRLADEIGLVCTGGSDRHTPSDPELGVELPEPRAEQLRTWLRMS